jgi:hypothetical protein
VPKDHEPAPVAQPDAGEANSARRPHRPSWTRLLKRVFDLDLEHCPNCGGELKIIAAILQTPVIEKILTHLGLQARVPPRAPARGQMPLRAVCERNRWAFALLARRWRTRDLIARQYSSR